LRRLEPSELDAVHLGHSTADAWIHHVLDVPRRVAEVLAGRNGRVVADEAHLQPALDGLAERPERAHGGPGHAALTRLLRPRPNLRGREARGAHALREGTNCPWRPGRVETELQPAPPELTRQVLAGEGRGGEGTRCRTEGELALHHLLAGRVGDANTR